AQGRGAGHPAQQFLRHATIHHVEVVQNEEDEPAEIETKRGAKERPKFPIQPLPCPPPPKAPPESGRQRASIMKHARCEIVPVLRTTLGRRRVLQFLQSLRGGIAEPKRSQQGLNVVWNFAHFSRKPLPFARVRHLPARGHQGDSPPTPDRDSKVRM